MKSLTTKRLLLRPFREEDADDVYAYAKNPAVGPAAGWKPHESVKESLEIVKMFIREGDVFAIVHQASGRVIGSLGLHRDRKRGFDGAREIGYVLSESFWGQGLAVEAATEAMRYAFEELGISILSVCHFPTNAQSRRVIEKCGFRYEGTLRMAGRLYTGEMVDSVCYSMTKEEFARQKG